METLQEKIANLEAHINFVQVYLLDRYKDDLSGLAKHIYGSYNGRPEIAGESAKRSLEDNIRICKERLEKLKAGLSV